MTVTEILLAIIAIEGAIIALECTFLVLAAGSLYTQLADLKYQQARVIDELERIRANLPAPTVEPFFK